MNSRIKKLRISSVFPLISFAVLATSIVIVLISGARLYSRANQRDTSDYYHRTVTSYITTRVMQSAVDGNYFVGDFYEAIPKESGNTFFFIERFDGVDYVTRLYYHNGALYELFSPLKSQLDPEDGESVLPLSYLNFSIDDKLLITEIVFDDNEKVTLRLSPRTEGADYEK